MGGERGDHRARAARGRNPLSQALLDRGFLQPFQQGDALVQRAREIEFAAHRALGNLGHLRLHAQEIGQLVDAFLPDHGRIHVAHQQAGNRDRIVGEQCGDGREMLFHQRSDDIARALGNGDFQYLAAMFQHHRFGKGLSGGG